MAVNPYKDVMASINPEDSFLTSFVKFLSQGNILDIAIGTTLGAAFMALVNSLSADVIMPVLSGLNVIDVSRNFYVVRNGDHAPYATAEDAARDAAVVIKYGSVVHKTLNFVIQAFAIFLILRSYMRVSRRIKFL